MLTGRSLYLSLHSLDSLISPLSTPYLVIQVPIHFSTFGCCLNHQILEIFASDLLRKNLSILIIPSQTWFTWLATTSSSSETQRSVDLSAFSNHLMYHSQRWRMPMISMANRYRQGHSHSRQTGSKPFYEMIVLSPIRVRVMVVCLHHLSVSAPLK